MATPRWRRLLGGARQKQRADYHRQRAGSAHSFEQLEPRTLLSVGPVELGPQTGFYDQPYVDIEMFSGTSGMGPYGSVFGWGLYPYNHFLLDTGSNAILSAREATLAMNAYGYEAPGEYQELGVAGPTDFDVSAPYRFDFWGTDSVRHTLAQTDDDVRILSSESVELNGPIFPYGIAGLVGMPAMAGRVTTFDMSAWADVEDISDWTPMEVKFSSTVPAPGAHRYSVALDDRVSFDPSDGLPPDSPPGAPLPSWAPIPFMTAVVGYGDNEVSGDFLLDSGAQMSMISQDVAFALGLDEDGDGDFIDDALYTIDIAGVGGSIEVPVMLIDRLSLPTEQGVDLVWTGTDPEELGLEVIVLDVAEGIDGIFGVDLLTSGLDFEIDPVTLEITLGGAAYFDQVHLDFRDMMSGEGKMYLDLHPDRVQVTPTGAATDVAEGGASDTYEVVLWSQPTANVTVHMSSYDGQVTAVDDAHPENSYLVFTPANWATPQLVQVTAVDDTVIEGDHVGIITHTATSLDDDYDGIRVSMVRANVTDNDASEVTGQYVFYNNSGWDDPLKGGSDDDAIAVDKEALLPDGRAELKNYTSYSRGINGIMVDVSNLPNPAAIGADDFEFMVGNDDQPEGWTPLAVESSVEVRVDQGDGGADRVVLTWPDGTIQNTWLQVTMLAGDDTGLAADSVFYFGNAVGETGDSTADARVDANDILQTRNHPHPFFNPAAIDCNYDFDRDQRVDALDVLIARNNQTTFFSDLELIDLSGSKAAGGKGGQTALSAEQDPPPFAWLGSLASIHGAAARDAVLASDIARTADRLPSALHRLPPTAYRLPSPAWVYQFEPPPTGQRPAKDHGPVRQAVDWLVANAEC